MQISLRWVNELVNLETVNLEDLINRLTLGGFEVEEILEVELPTTKATALEISATANRSDSLSIQGLSLEIAALLNDSPKRLQYSTKICPWSQSLERIQSMSTNQITCSGFISIIIENLNNFTSPKWLQEKLLASGFPVTDKLIDFQNYILVETGYPLEFYDLDQIYSQLQDSQVQLSLTSVENSINFVARNETNYSLDESVLLLRANNLPISIAGIIASKTSQYSSTTKTLLVEGSIFNAAHIRQESRRLGLRTNRSSRYEKSLKPTTLLESIYRFVSLLRIHNPNLTCKLHTIVKPIHDPKRHIELDYTKVKQVLGPIQKTKDNQYIYISPQSITDALERLQFQVTYNFKNFKWNIAIPSLRNDDIVREIDVIEEIGRVYGFNNFLTRLPKIQSIGKKDLNYQTRQKLTSCLVNLGLNELIQYSLVPSEIYVKNDISLVNPLVKEYSHLRSSLLPNLLKTVEENFKKGNFILEGFEYGHVFLADFSSLVHEREVIAGILGGIKTKSNWSESFQSLNWFEAKGKIEQLFQKLNITTYWKSYKPIKERMIFHLYCTAELLLSDGTKLGIFGQLSPIVANKLNLSTDIYLFEFNFDLIKNQIQQTKLSVYQDYSLYPKIIKDLSFIIKDTIPFRKVQEVLYFNGSQFLKEVNLLDEYRGKSIPQHYKSLCLQLVFQSDLETLQTERIETIVRNLTKVLNQKFHVTIRV
jgi:phenylalanyl-tRNA synthetase beta chain